MASEWTKNAAVTIGRKSGRAQACKTLATRTRPAAELLHLTSCRCARAGLLTAHCPAEHAQPGRCNNDPVSTDNRPFGRFGLFHVLAFRCTQQLFPLNIGPLPSGCAVTHHKFFLLEAARGAAKARQAFLSSVSPVGQWR